ncbi:MAG TPA: hypothetical protein VKA85_12365 [Candidatus Limnocylindrales bacterium]|nr:hypothetical protein [Candidatus Limnocylindrales bacterium]
MDRRTVAFFVGVLVAIAVLGLGASGFGRSSTAGRPDGSPTVDGIVVGVDATSLNDVSGFRLRTDDGRTVTFGLSELRDRVDFPPGHLSEHVASSVRVRVWYRDDGDRIEALWLEDAAAT